MQCTGNYYERNVSLNVVLDFYSALVIMCFQQSEQDNGKKQKIESDAADPYNLHDNIENHGVDPGATEDGDRPEEFEDHNFAEVSYDDYNGIGDEDYGYDEDFDFS